MKKIAVIFIITSMIAWLWMYIYPISQERIKEQKMNFMYHTLNNCEFAGWYKKNGEQVAKFVTCNENFVLEFLE